MRTAVWSATETIFMEERDISVYDPGVVLDVAVIPIVSGPILRYKEFLVKD